MPDRRRRRSHVFQRPWALAAAGAAAAVIVVAAVVLASGGGDSRPEYPYPVQAFEDQGREHLPVGQRYDFYNSNPPTSGPHSSQPAEWGVHEEPLPKEVPLHNLEHGGVAILYDCSASVPLDSTDCQALRDQLATLVEGNVSTGKLLLMAPYAGMEHHIALTAWRTLDAFDTFDAARVQAFIDSFERKFNPEGF